MSHLTSREAYTQLIDRINRFPQGAPPSEVLYGILRLLFSEQEAELVALLPIKPFTSAVAAREWKKTEDESRTILDALADRGILLDAEENGRMVYSLPPPMAGFFEFSLMRVRTDVDQKLLSELLHQYLNVEEEFIKQLFTEGVTQLGRTFVQEQVLPPDRSVHVLDYDRASEVIRTASHRAVGICYCRHKMEHLGRACDAPMDVCLTLNSVADSLVRHGVARSIDVKEGLDILQLAQANNLVQFGENVREGVNFICNCCGCCCEALLAQKRFGALHPIHTTNFLPVIDNELCNGCGKCVDVCAVEAMSLVSANDPKKKRKRRAVLLEDMCLGCGVCVRNCPTSGIRLVDRPERVLTPLNNVHRTVLMAVERGKLQNLIFDNHAHWNHRAMASILGAILRLPPIKRSMATKQMKSRYLEYLVTHSDTRSH
jgi:NAD-dependent dihydropyrimidine dehydrogenase PreA subunit